MFIILCELRTQSSARAAAIGCGGGGDRGGVGDEIGWKGREEAGQKIKSSQYLCNTTGSSETKLGNKATGCVISLPRPVLRKGKLWDSLRKRS